MNNKNIPLIVFIAFFVGFFSCVLFNYLIVGTKFPRVVEAYATLRLEKVPITLPPGNGSFWLWNEQTKTSVKISDDAVVVMANNLKKK